MSEFTEYNFREALSLVYARSVRDPEYRNLCLSDPVAAIRAVSEIDLPDTLKLRFFENRVDIVYSFLLPPLPDARASSEEQRNQAYQWAALCTWPTTIGESSP
jgi:hypothetical protein